MRPLRLVVTALLLPLLLLLPLTPVAPATEIVHAFRAIAVRESDGAEFRGWVFHPTEQSPSVRYWLWSVTGPAEEVSGSAAAETWWSVVHAAGLVAHTDTWNTERGGRFVVSWADSGEGVYPAAGTGSLDGYRFALGPDKVGP